MTSETLWTISCREYWVTAEGKIIFDALGNLVITKRCFFEKKQNVSIFRENLFSLSAFLCAQLFVVSVKNLTKKCDFNEKNEYIILSFYFLELHHVKIYLVKYINALKLYFVNTFTLLLCYFDFFLSIIVYNKEFKFAFIYVLMSCNSNVIWCLKINFTNCFEHDFDNIIPIKSVVDSSVGRAVSFSHEGPRFISWRGHLFVLLLICALIDC
jgi:hypothetical protein